MVKLIKMKNKKAQAGLDIFLSVIAMLFVIGIIVMAFALAGAQIQDTDSAFDRTGSISVANESHYMNGSVGNFDLTFSSLRSSLCTVSTVYNASGIIDATGNYSVSNCRVSLTTGSPYENETWNVSYSYTYDSPNQVATVINDTVSAISGATDWFAIFITISAIVVLILLIVLIVISLRGAGLMGGGRPGA